MKKKQKDERKRKKKRDDEERMGMRNKSHETKSWPSFYYFC